MASPSLVQNPLSPSEKLARIRIVLSHPSHPGNIGAAARAMKNMGLSQLVLVNPKRFPDDEAIARVSNPRRRAHVGSRARSVRLAELS